MNVIKHGFPENKNELPVCVHDYWSYRDELSTQDGLVYRGTRIIIPVKMRSQILTRAHASHLGIQYTVNIAKEIMFWPRMHSELVETVKRCQTCQEHAVEQQQEPMMTYPLPTYPWQVVTANYFEINQNRYCVLADTYSDYIVLLLVYCVSHIVPYCVCTHTVDHPSTTMLSDYDDYTLYFCRNFVNLLLIYPYCHFY